MSTAMFAGSSSQAAVNCYLAAVPGASITDFARHGLDSSNAFCGPFPCSVLGKQQASFGGINPSVGSNIMYFPSGRSLYQGVHLSYKTSVANPTKRVARLDMAIAYAWSRYRTNLAEPNGSGGDYSLDERRAKIITVPIADISATPALTGRISLRSPQ